MIESLENCGGSFKVPKTPGLHKRGRPKRSLKDRGTGHKGTNISEFANSCAFEIT